MVDLVAGVRRLVWETTHEPVYYRGISEEALEVLKDVVGELERVDPAAFELQPRGDGEVRRTIRYLSALVPDHVPDEYIPEFIADIVANPHLNGNIVRSILAGGHTTTSHYNEAGALRQVGRLLRAGHSQREVAAIVGVGRDTVTRVATFLGVAEAREQVLRDAAADFLENQEGGTKAFAEANGIRLTKARAVLQSVAEALEIEYRDPNLTREA